MACSCSTPSNMAHALFSSPLLHPPSIPSLLPVAAPQLAQRALSVPILRHEQLRVLASSAEPAPAARSASPIVPKKPVFSMKKGQIVRVDKEKYLNSVEYLAVGHPPNYKGLDYIYEDRGEVLDIRLFDTGEYALIGWAGISTSPAWLPTNMLIKAEKLSYKRT